MITSSRRLLLALIAFATVAGADSGVTIRNAWARATPPGASVGAAYLTIEGGAQADRLVGAQSPRAGMTQIHEVTAAAGMFRMRPVDAVDIPARQTVTLAPEGLHLMLMDLSRPLVAGEHFTLTLDFAQAGKVEVQVEVRAPGESAPPGH